MLHWSCENCTQIHHRLKCTSKMTRLAPWSCSTWVLSATELKKEQSIFCSCQGICKIQPSISSTHFSQRQKLLHSFELTFICTDLREPRGHMAAVLHSKPSPMYKYVHTYAQKGAGLFPVIYLHFPGLGLSPSYLYTHLGFHKSQFL